MAGIPPRPSSSVRIHRRPDAPPFRKKTASSHQRSPLHRMGSLSPLTQNSGDASTVENDYLSAGFSRLQVTVHDRKNTVPPYRACNKDRNNADLLTRPARRPQSRRPDDFADGWAHSTPNRSVSRQQQPRNYTNSNRHSNNSNSSHHNSTHYYNGHDSSHSSHSNHNNRSHHNNRDDSHNFDESDTGTRGDVTAYHGTINVRQGVARRNFSNHITAHEAESSSRAHVRGLVALDNLGNTCFMNTILQCLLSLPELLHYFSSGNYQQDLNPNSPTKGLAEEFANLAVELSERAPGSVACPSRFLREVHRAAPQFQGYNQHDSQEFLRFLLSALHEDVNRVRRPPPYEHLKDIAAESDVETSLRWAANYKAFDDSVLSDMFCGQLRSVVTCGHCGRPSKTFDPIWDLSIPIPRELQRSSCNLKDCIAAFFQQERLAGDDRFYCSGCKALTESTKVLAIARLPRVLVLHVKRFSYSDQHRRKLSTHLAVPSDIDMSALMPRTEFHHPKTKYALFAVSNHVGSAGSGHYTACADVSHSWYTFDDDVIKEVRFSWLSGSAPYVLFYRQV